MIFDKLYAENLYSFPKLELDFSKYTKGTTIILGKNLDMNSDNAAGKSNILKIIYYAIWGKDIKGVALPKIIRQKSEEGSLVVFTFRKDDNTYIIVRFMNYKKNINILGMPVKGSGMYFFINKKPYIIEKDSTKTQGQIDSIIGCSPKVWLNSVMTRQRKDDSETFLGAVDSKKKEMLSEILDLNFYETALKKVKEEITANNKLLDKVLMRISTLTEQITEHKNKKTSYQEKIQSLISENEISKKEIVQKISQLQIELAQIQENKKIPLLDISLEKDLLSQLVTKRKPMQDEILKEADSIVLKTKNESIISNSENNILELQKNILTINNEIATLNEDIKLININDATKLTEELTALTKSLIDSEANLKEATNANEELNLLYEKKSNESQNNEKLKELINKIKNDIQKIKDEASCVECKRKFLDSESAYFSNLITHKQSQLDSEELNLIVSNTQIKDLDINIARLTPLSADINARSVIVQSIKIQVEEIKDKIQLNKINIDKLSQANTSIQKADGQVKELTTKIETIQKEVLVAQTVLAKIPLFLQKIQKLKDAVIILDKEIQEKELRINDYDAISQAIRTADELKSEKTKRISELEHKVATIDSNILPYQEFLISSSDSLTKYEDDFKKALQSKNELEEKLKYLSFWEIGFSKTGIRSFIIDDVINLLNHYVKSYIDILSNGVMQIVFEPESTSSKDVVSNKISTKYFINGNEQDFDLTSGGETQRLVLGVDLAISEVVEARSGSKFSLKFLDEPFTNIDSAGQLKALALFRKLSEERNGFFIISHDKELQTSCDNAIYVIKQNDISKIVSAEDFFNAE